MHLSAKILGAHTATALATRTAGIILTIGSDRFRRRDLAAVECFNFIAAQHLSAACAALEVKNARDLFDSVPPSALVLPGVGAITLAVLGAAFESKGIGGNQPLEAWAAKHRATGAREFVTFDTLKTQERKRSEGETRAKKARADRKHARRDQAQRLRVERFERRTSTPRYASK